MTKSVEIGSARLLLSEIAGVAILTTNQNTIYSRTDLYLLLKSGDKHIVDPDIANEVLQWWDETHECVKKIGN